MNIIFTLLLLKVFPWAPNCSFLALLPHLEVPQMLHSVPREEGQENIPGEVWELTVSAE